jgi:hypothetical protein
MALKEGDEPLTSSAKRLYAPTEAYFDKSWPLPPIEKAK